METEVLDEMVLQPENHKPQQDREGQHELEDMHPCLVGNVCRCFTLCVCVVTNKAVYVDDT